MHEDLSAKAITACFGLAAFIVAILAGIFVDNPLDAVLSKAIPALFIGALVGYPIGRITTNALNQNILNAAESAKNAAEAATAASAEIARLEANGNGNGAKVAEAGYDGRQESTRSAQAPGRKAA